MTPICLPGFIVVASLGTGVLRQGWRCEVWRIPRTECRISRTGIGLTCCSQTAFYSYYLVCGYLTVPMLTDHVVCLDQLISPRGDLPLGSSPLSGQVSPVTPRSSVPRTLYLCLCQLFELVYQFCKRLSIFNETPIFFSRICDACDSFNSVRFEPTST